MIRLVSNFCNKAMSLTRRSNKKYYSLPSTAMFAAFKAKERFATFLEYALIIGIENTTGVTHTKKPPSGPHWSDCRLFLCVNGHTLAGCRFHNDNFVFALFYDC